MENRRRLQQHRNDQTSCPDNLGLAVIPEVSLAVRHMEVRGSHAFARAPPAVPEKDAASPDQHDRHIGPLGVNPIDEFFDRGRDQAGGDLAGRTFHPSRVVGYELLRPQPDCRDILYGKGG